MTNPYEPPSAGADLSSPIAAGERSRHGCLTAWLVLMLAANSLTFLANLVMSDQIRQATPSLPEWALPVLAVTSAANVAFTIGLFRWKKWGFIGFAATSVIAAIINLSSGLPVGQVVLGFAGIAILYGVLQMGTPSGWSQMD